MATTTWRPRETASRSWLLANGAIVDTPPFEETASGLKVRVTGTEQSGYARDLDDMVWRHVESVAKQRKTKPWMPVFGHGHGHGHGHHRAWPTERGPALHFAKPDANGSWAGATTLWWRFRHPVLPIEATVRVTMVGNGSYDQRDSSQRVDGQVLLPSTHPNHARRGEEYASTGDLAMLSTEPLPPEGAGQIRDWLAATSPEWGIEEALSAPVSFPTARAGTTELLRRVRVVEEIDRLGIPDLRSRPGYLVLELVDTNVTGEFIESLVSFLDSEPAVKRALVAYQDFRTALRDAGLVLDDTTTDQLLAALQAGADAITVQLGKAAAPGGTDPHHSLTVRLATGTFVVNCSHRAQKATSDQNVVADRWQEALAIASITGREDELLAYARAWALKSEELRARKVLAVHV